MSDLLSDIYLQQRQMADEDVQFQADMDRAKRTDARNAEIMADYRRREEVMAPPSTGETIVDAINPLENLPENILAGAIGAGANLLNVFDQTVMQPTLQGLASEDTIDKATELGFIPTKTLEDSLQVWRNSLRTDDTTADAVVTEMAQFLIPFSAGLRALNVARAGRIPGMLASDFTTAMSAMDPDVGRFIDLLDLVDPGREISSTWVEWLRTGEGESDLEARFKNGVDSATAFTVGGVLYQSGKALRQAWRGGASSRGAARTQARGQQQRERLADQAEEAFAPAGAQ